MRRVAAPMDTPMGSWIWTPHMFRAANIVLINKIDLAVHFDFDETLCRANIQEVNPDIRVISLSAKNGDGMEQWMELLESEMSQTQLYIELLNLTP